MDHVQVRFPTNVEDVARVIYDMTRKHPLPPILLALILLLLLLQSVSQLKVPYSLTPQNYPPSRQSYTTRPQRPL
jgi:hypothetical protein